MKKTNLIFAFLCLFLTLNSKAGFYRWLESQTDPELIQKKNEFLKSEYEKRQKYLDAIDKTQLNQIIYGPYHTNEVALKNHKLRSKEVLSLTLEKASLRKLLKLGDEIIFDDTQLYPGIHQFSDFYVDPLEEYVVVPVYARGSTDEYILYVISLKTKKVLKNFPQAAAHGFFWKEPHVFSYILGSGLTRFNFSYDFKNDENVFEIEPFPYYASNDGKFFFNYKGKQIGDENKVAITVKPFGDENEFEFYGDNWVNLTRVTTHGLVFENYDSFEPVIAYVPYRYTFGGEVEFGEPLWHTLETQGMIFGSFENKGFFVFETLYGVDQRLHLFSPQGQFLGALPSPTNGTLAAIEVKEENKIAFRFRSPVNKNYEVILDLTNPIWDVEKMNIDLMKDEAGAEFVTQYFSVTSTDEAQIPVRMVYKKEVVLDSNAKIFVEAYGGHGAVANFKAHYSQPTYLYLKAGGVHVSPGVRGGGEYGREWHNAGKHLNKLKTYEDIENVVSFLHHKGLGTPQTTALMGWSSGGMMTAAVLTRRPDLFKLVIPGNGLTDLVRKEILDLRFDRGWSNEYGGHHRENELNFLKSYSPLIFAQQKREYPTVFVMVGDGDSRVNPIHSYKLVAALSENQTASNPIILSQQISNGHWPTSIAYMGAEGLSATIELYSVLFHELGLDASLLNKEVQNPHLEGFGDSLWENQKRREKTYLKEFSLLDR